MERISDILRKVAGEPAAKLDEGLRKKVEDSWRGRIKKSYLGSADSIEIVVESIPENKFGDLMITAKINKAIVEEDRGKLAKALNISMSPESCLKEISVNNLIGYDWLNSY